MTEFLDISPVISPRLGVWPGDTPFEREDVLRIVDGANLDLSWIRSTVHLGAHADAPSHYRRGGADIAARPLDLYFGDCQVMHVAIERGARIRPGHLLAAVAAPRVLFRTGTFPDPEHWNADFASLSPESIHFLADHGVRLVGIDTPSIDPQGDALLASHQAAADRDLAILEGLALAHVAPGRYTLCAFPLRIEGADASPVRAVLLN